jgi:Glycoside Hydrolase Family 113
VHRLPSILWLFLLASFFALTRGPGPHFFYLGGIQVNEPDHAAWVRALDGGGFNTVALTVYARQGDWDSANLWWDAETPAVDGDDWVVHEIRAARRQRLHTVLILRTALDHAFERNKFLWHGMIQPATDEALADWFERYRGFVVRWAEIAEREGVDVLAIGSELGSLTSTVPVESIPALEEYWSNPEKVADERRQRLEVDSLADERRVAVRGHEDHPSVASYLTDHDQAHADWARRVAHLDEADPVAAINRRRRLLDRGWRRLAAAARERYSGELTYAANFDQYEAVGFWDAFDVIGINAYFPLLEEWIPESERGELAGRFEARWSSLLSSLDGFRRRVGLAGHRILFTEIGYAARELATAQPWSVEGASVLPSAAGPRLVVWNEQPIDPRERALALRGLCSAEAARGGDLLAGLLYWKLSTVASHRDVEPFVLIVGPEAPPDPLAAELERCGRVLSGPALAPSGLG